MQAEKFFQHLAESDKPEERLIGLKVLRSRQKAELAFAAFVEPMDLEDGYQEAHIAYWQAFNAGFSLADISHQCCGAFWRAVGFAVKTKRLSAGAEELEGLAVPTKDISWSAKLVKAVKADGKRKLAHYLVDIAKNRTNGSKTKQARLVEKEAKYLSSKVLAIAFNG